MSPPPQVAERWTWCSDVAPHRSDVVLEATRLGETFIEMAVHCDGDGPCVNLTPAKARKVANALLRRADLVEETSAVVALRGEPS